jgi:hypothetical protein
MVLVLFCIIVYMVMCFVYSCLILQIICSYCYVTYSYYSLVQGSPTDCGASLCVITKPRERGGHSLHRAIEPEKINKIINTLLLLCYVFLLLCYVIFG